MDNIEYVKTYEEAFDVMSNVFSEDAILNFTSRARPVFRMLESLFEDTSAEKRPARFQQFLESFLSKKVDIRLTKSYTLPIVKLIEENELKYYHITTEIATIIFEVDWNTQTVNRMGLWINSENDDKELVVGKKIY